MKIRCYEGKCPHGDEVHVCTQVDNDEIGFPSHLELVCEHGDFFQIPREEL